MSRLRGTPSAPTTRTTYRSAASAQRSEPRRVREETYSEQRVRIEAIRTSNPIEQVIGGYVELRPSGRRFVACCPFHDDRSPSLVVYPVSQSWYCFGCDVGGDVFCFIEQIENIPFSEALQRLGSDPFAPGKGARSPVDGVTLSSHAGPSGIASLQRRRVRPDSLHSWHISGRESEISEVEPKARRGKAEGEGWWAQGAPLELSEEHFRLLTAASQVYHAAIFGQPAVLEYLAQRKVNLEMIRRHRIGYATGNALTKYFRFRGWEPEMGNDLGLIGPRGEYFRQRIVIPELRNGKATYLVGRATQAYHRAKYLGLPGVPKPLYGAEFIQEGSDVYVCEGPMDWLTLVEWGYPAVALLGSHLKREYVADLARAQRIWLVTDSDGPGRKSADQLVETFGERARIVPPLPNAKDVNELATRPQAREIFARLIREVA